MFIIKIDSSLKLQDLTSIFNHLEVSSQTLSTLFHLPLIHTQKHAPASDSFWLSGFGSKDAKVTDKTMLEPVRGSISIHILN